MGKYRGKADYWSDGCGRSRNMWADALAEDTHFPQSVTATSDLVPSIAAELHPVPTSPSSEGKRGLRLPIAVFALAVLAFSAGAWARPYWLDELVTVSVLRRSLREVWAISLHTDVALGPYYLLTYPWGLVSETPVWMRLLSVIAMAIAVGFLATLGRRMAGAQVGLAAGLLFIAVPEISRYAQEVRPYALATLVACIATYVWWRAIEANLGRFYTLYSVCLVALGLLHAYALTLVLAHALTVLVFPDLRKRVIPLLVSIGAAGVILAPYLWILSEKAGGPGSRPPMSWETAKSILDLMAGSGALCVALIGLMLAGAIAAVREVRWRKVYVLGITWALCGPVVLIPLQAVADKTTMVPRYYLVFVPGLCLAAGVGATYLFRLWRFSPIVLALVIVAAGWGQQEQVRSRAANFRYDALPIIAAVDVPALRDYPVWPDPRGFLLLDGSSPLLTQSRIPFFTSPRTGRGLVPDAVAESVLRNSLAGVPAVILATGGPVEAAQIAHAKALGFSKLVVRCEGSHAVIRVYVRPGSADTIESGAKITKQITARTRDLKCARF